MLYNPWSIVNFFESMKLAPFWVNTEGSGSNGIKLSVSMLMKNEMREKIRELIINFYEENNNTVEIMINPYIDLHELDSCSSNIWALLAYTGYLCIIRLEQGWSRTIICYVKIPYHEVLRVYHMSIDTWFHKELKLKQIRLLNQLDIENITQFEKQLKPLLFEISNVFGHINNELFHSIMDSLYLLKGSTHRLSSKKQTHSDRSYSIFYPMKYRGGKIIIHVYKVFDHTTTTSTTTSTTTPTTSTTIPTTTTSTLID